MAVTALRAIATADGRAHIMSSQTQPQTSPSPAADVPPAAPRRSGINWFRFWIQMAVAMLVFNIVAGLATWYFIFPHLHPAR
jgi:hypothetical protein